jgi:alpha-galactosidase
MTTFDVSLPGFSFLYDGAASADFLPGWAHQVSAESMPGGSLERYTWDEPGAGGLQVTAILRRFAGSPALDWLLSFENRGTQPEPLLEQVLPLDLSLPFPAGERLRLHHANGSACRMDDFLPLVTELPPGSQQTLAPVGGRSSNGTLPFMNLQWAGGGLVVAVGWSGQWQARFERAADRLHLSAGMQRTHLRLYPGERIRTPRILLLPWQGPDVDAGQNLLRQLLLAHYLPRLDGELVLPPAAQCLQAYFYLTGQAGEALEMAALPKTAALGAEAYWIDACWYGGQGEWWQQVGSWEVNRERFPHGLRPISDAAHQAGMRFVLWFEPERARPASGLAQEHPDFFLRSSHDPENLLLDLGNPAARAYLTDLISNRISEYGVDIYRQDFNFDPLPYWQAADLPDRVGMAEIGHVTGLYAFWDTLRQRHPGLWIDNCASGGRRIDLETLSRSLPLWPSDFTDVIGLPYGQGLHVGDQCINAGLARWVPLFGGGVWNFTPYGTRGQSIGGFTFGYHVDPADFPPDEHALLVSHNDVLAKGKTLLDDDFPLQAARQAIAEWQRLRPFCLGDFYLLLPLTAADHDWCAWQFHRADLASGVTLVFRRHRSPFPALELSLKGLQPEARYAVSVSPGYISEPEQHMSGQQLLNLVVAIPEKPGSRLIAYRQLPGR